MLSDTELIRSPGVFRGVGEWTVGQRDTGSHSSASSTVEVLRSEWVRLRVCLHQDPCTTRVLSPTVDKLTKQQTTPWGRRSPG